MRTQNLAPRNQRLGGTEALGTQAHGIGDDRCSNPENSDKLRQGCTQATFTSPLRRAGTWCPCASLHEVTRDRRYTCRKASRAFSQSVSSPSSQHAHSLQKKSSLWSSRSRPSPFRPASTSKPIGLGAGRTLGAVPSTETITAQRPCILGGATC